MNILEFIFDTGKLTPDELIVFVRKLDTAELVKFCEMVRCHRDVREKLAQDELQTFLKGKK